MSLNVLLLLLFLAISSLYLPLNRRPSRYYWESRFDAYVPLVPAFVLPYAFFFPFIAIAIAALWNTPYITPFLAALSIAKAGAMLFWYVVPNGVARPNIDPVTWLHKALIFFYRHDKDTNAFPSSHVFISLLCAYFLALAHPAHAFASWFAGTLITLSTVFTKQHYVVDILGGIGMGFVSIVLVALAGLFSIG